LEGILGFERDNLPAFDFDRPWKWLVLPGLVLQWLFFMFPGGKRMAVAMSARHARSEIMTYAYAALFYIGVLVTSIIVVRGQ
jgi:hypothetical protein